MDKTAYAQVPASEGPEPSPTSPWVTSPTVVSSPTSPPAKAPDGSLQFAKAALAFHDQLGDIRKKRVSTTVKAVGQSPEMPHEDPAPAAAALPEPPAEKTGDALSEDPVVAKRLRILRLVQSTLTAIFSVAIAALQAKAYGCFQSTKNVPGAWPVNPNLFPTIMLMVVAIAGAAFDLCLLGAYLFPRKAKGLFRLAVSSHNLLTCVKGLSYGLTSAVCKSGFDFGNTSGQNNDLWSWTCSPKGDAMASVNQADANCMGQTCAWAFALVQVGIEAVGVVGTRLVKELSTRGKKVDSNDEFDVEFRRMEKMQEEFNQTITELTPDKK